MGKRREVKSVQNKSNIKTYDIFIFFIFLVTLFYNQFVTLDKLSNIINPIAPFGNFSDFFNFLSLYGKRIFSNIDLYVFYILVISIVYFVYREIKGNIFSDFLRDNKFNHKKIIFILFILSLISLRYYFSLGYEMHWGDASYFIGMSNAYYNSFKHMNFFPYFSYMVGCGTPYYMEYAPLIGYLSGLLNLIFRNIYFSIKLTLFLFHFFSVVGTYFFIYEISKSKRVAFISAISILLLYFHSHISIYLGRYSSTPGWTFLPFILYFFERGIKTLNLKYYALFALFITFLILSNVGIAYIFFIAIFSYISIRIVYCIVKKEKYQKKVIFNTIIFFILGILAGSLYIYFITIELKNTAYGHLFGVKNDIKIVKDIFYPIIFWNNYKIRIFNFKYSWQSGYWGITIIILSIFGLYYLIKRRKNISLVLVAILLLFIEIGFGWFPLFKIIPYFYKYTNARYLYALAMMTVFLSGFGYLYLSKNNNINISNNKLFILIIIFIFIDLFPTTFQDTFGRRYGGNAYPVFHYLKEKYGYGINNKMANFRIDQIGDGTYSYVNRNWRNEDASLAEIEVPFIFEEILSYYPLSIFGVNFYQDYILPLMKNKEIIESDNFFKYYFFHNTRFLISSYPLNAEDIRYKKIYKVKNIYLAEFKYYSPVIYSYKIAKLKINNEKNYNVKKLLNKYNINFSNHISSILYVTNNVYSKEINIGENKEISYFTSTILKNDVKEDKINLIIKVSDDIFAQLSFTAYPGTIVYNNGKKIKYFESPTGFIVVRLNKGINNIIITPTPSKKLRFFILVSILSFLLILFFIFKEFFKKSLKIRKE